MTPRRKLYSVYLDPEHLVGLKKVQERDGAPPSEQIRRALDDWLARKGALPKKRRRGKEDR